MLCSARETTHERAFPPFPCPASAVAAHPRRPTPAWSCCSSTACSVTRRATSSLHPVAPVWCWTGFPQQGYCRVHNQRRRTRGDDPDVRQLRSRLWCAGAGHRWTNPFYAKRGGDRCACAPTPVDQAQGPARQRPSSPSRSPPWWCGGCVDAAEGGVPDHDDFTEHVHIRSEAASPDHAAATLRDSRDLPARHSLRSHGRGSRQR